MKIWMVLSYDYGETEILAVYSNYDAAVEHRNSGGEYNRGRKFGYAPSYVLGIEEFEVLDKYEKV